jgi:hypothetical protein
MKHARRLLFVIGVPAALLVVIVAGIELRSDLLDAAMLAIKEDRGSVAIRHLKPLAIVGDPQAALLITDVYAYGIGDVKRDDKEALRWLKKADGAVGVDIATIELSYAKYYRGEVTNDEAESIKWLRLSAAAGNKEAIDLLAKAQQRR